VTLYLDSSSILSVYLSERGRHDVVQKEIEGANSTFCSILALVEVRAGLARARARFKESPPRLTNAGYRRALALFAADWPTFGRTAITEAIVTDGAELAEKYFLRGYDAVHLSTALFLRARIPDLMEVSTWDEDLANAALAAGLALAH
jgi:predicted nucleic acid-binding protein